jgi:hypothetical protein
MPVFNNAVEALRHLKKIITNSVSYTAKEAGFPNNTPNATKGTSSTASLFPLKITDKERKEKYERGIGGAIVDKIIDDALKNGFVVNKIDTPEEPDRALTKKLTKVYNEKILTELDKALKRSRLYGYSFLLLGSKDGQDLNTPLTNKKGQRWTSNGYQSQWRISRYDFIRCYSNINWNKSSGRPYQ